LNGKFYKFSYLYLLRSFINYFFTVSWICPFPLRHIGSGK